MAQSYKRLLSLVLCLAALAACTHKAEAPPVLSLQVTRADCVAKPTLAHPVSIAFEAGKTQKKIQLRLDEQSDCWQRETGNALYAVVEFPKVTTPSIVEVMSLSSKDGIFAPYLMMLDEKGNTLRTITKDQMLFRGSALSASFRLHEGEKYLVAASDPQLVGQTDTKIEDGTTSNMISTGTAAVMVYSGYAGEATRTYSHTGLVEVKLREINATAKAE